MNHVKEEIDAPAAFFSVRPWALALLRGMHNTKVTLDRCVGQESKKGTTSAFEGDWEVAISGVRKDSVQKETLAVSVKGMNPAPHIHEHLRYTIMATALRTLR